MVWRDSRTYLYGALAAVFGVSMGFRVHDSSGSLWLAAAVAVGIFLVWRLLWFSTSDRMAGRVDQEFFMTLYEFLDQERVICGVFGELAKSTNVQQRDLRVFACIAAFSGLMLFDIGTATLAVLFALVYFGAGLILQASATKSEVKRALEEVCQRRMQRRRETAHQAQRWRS